jgi:hypothetical protein
MDIGSFAAAVVTSYGFPGLVLVSLVFILYKLVDRGFTFQVPPKRR